MQVSGSSIMLLITDGISPTPSPLTIVLFDYLGAISLHVPLSWNKKGGRVILEIGVGIILDPAFL